MFFIFFLVFVSKKLPFPICHPAPNTLHCATSTRDLLVAAINEVLDKNLITLNATTSPQQDGYVFVDLFGFPSVVLWQDIGFEELRISVWI